MVPRSAIYQTFTVDTNVDSPLGTSTSTKCADSEETPKCSLRAAIGAADNDTGHVDDVVIPSGMRLTLSAGTLDVFNSMFIDGTGASVNGNHQEVFDVYNTPAVEITGLEITGGAESGDGGGIYQGSGSLVLSSVDVTGNCATDYGGGIYTYTGQLWIEDSSIGGNTAGEGGGVSVNGDDESTDTSVSISNSSLGGSKAGTGNTAWDGAGLFDDGVVQLADSTVSWNQAGTSSPSCGLADAPVAPHVAATFDGYGVGIYNENVIDATGDTLAHDTANGGGGAAALWNEGLATVEHSALVDDGITGSEYCIDGGAIFNDYSLAMTDDSVSGTTNSGMVDGGVLYSDGGNTTWTGGSITDTHNGTSTLNDDVNGGVFYFLSYVDYGVRMGKHVDHQAKGHHTRRAAPHQELASYLVDGVSISGTTNVAGTYEVVGGILYNVADGTIENSSITGTTDSAEYIYGGLFANDENVTLDGLTLSDSVVHATSGSDGEAYVEGGVTYNYGNMVVNGLASTDSDVVASLAKGATATAGTAVDGGDVFTSYDCEGCGGTFTANGMSFVNSTVEATSADGYIYGGALLNDGYGIYRDTQFVSAKVLADACVEGGLVYNDAWMSASAFTVGNALVDVPSGAGTVGCEEGARPDTSSFRPKVPLVASSVSGVGTIVWNEDTLNVVNGTFDDVTSSVAAGGAYDWGVVNATNSQLQLTNTTIANDSMSGPKGTSWLVYDEGLMSLRNSIVASTVPSLNCALGQEVTHDIYAVYSIDNGTTCGFKGAGDQQNTNPKVLPLKDNGGPVETAEPSPTFSVPSAAGSTAIDRGTNVGCPATDARGLSRPQHGTCDIGAYENEALGLDLSGMDGGLFHLGAGNYDGSVKALVDSGTVGPLEGPIVATAATPDHHGYWEVGSDGGVFAFGDAKFRGALARALLAAPIVGIAPTPTGDGYWLVDSSGHVFSFGDAIYYGSEDWKIIGERVVGIASTRDGKGYWLATAGGNVLAYGDAVGHGSPHASGMTLNSPIIGIAATPDGGGYWLAARDGGVFAYGDAHFFGSTGAMHMNAPVVAFAVTPDGLGYWLVGSDGGTFNYGDARFVGSLGALRLAAPVSGATSAN